MPLAKKTLPRTLLFLLPLLLMACAPLSVPQAEAVLAQATAGAQGATVTAAAQAQATQAAFTAWTRATQAFETQTAATATALAAATHQQVALTQQAWTLAQEQAEATTAAGHWTATAEAQATADTIHLAALATIEAAQAQAAVNAVEKSTLEVERARQMNGVLAAVPWLVLVGLLLVGLPLAWRYGNAHVNQKNVIRNGNGDVETIILEGEWPRQTVLHTPAKALHPTYRLTSGDVAARPSAPTLAQLRLTENEQKIRLARALETRQRIRQVLLRQELPDLVRPAAQARQLPVDAQPLPPLPTQVLFPGHQPGRAALGVNQQGDVGVDWPHLGHVMVAGMTRYGKSNFLRLLAVQAIKDGHAIATIDHQDRTFARFASHPSTFSAARNRRSVAATVEAVVAEHHRREQLFQQAAAAHPHADLDDLPAYQRVTGVPIPRLLFFIDEFTVLINLAGKRSALYEQLLNLVCESAKFGLHVIASGQVWEKQIAGPIREQMATRVCFHVSTPSQSRIVLGEQGAERLQRPGRALTNHWRLLQTYLVEKTHLAALTGLTPAGSLPRPTPPTHEPSPPEAEKQAKQTRIRQLAAQGCTAREIEKQVFNYTGGHAHEFVKTVLQSLLPATTPGETPATA